MLTVEEKRLANELVQTIKRSGISISARLDEGQSSVVFLVDKKYTDQFPKDITRDLGPYTTKTAGEDYKFTIPVQNSHLCSQLIEFCKIAITPPPITDNRRNRAEEPLYLRGNNTRTQFYDRRFAPPEPTINITAWEKRDKPGPSSQKPATHSQPSSGLRYGAPDMRGVVGPGKSQAGSSSQKRTTAITSQFRQAVKETASPGDDARRQFMSKHNELRKADGWFTRSRIDNNSTLEEIVENAMRPNSRSHRAFKELKWFDADGNVAEGCPEPVKEARDRVLTWTNGFGHTS